MQGVIILALKKPSYAIAAFNLALSIKHYNPQINITLISDGEHQKHFAAVHYSVFDWIKEINELHYTDSNGAFSPAIAKINIHKYSTYSETLYIDADSLALQDLQPLFNELKNNSFKSNVLSGYTQWTDSESFLNFFGFSSGKTINSSWMYYEDSKVFEKANEFYLNGFDPEKIAPKWGQSLPDELFFNAACISCSIDPEIGLKPMFFTNETDQRSNEAIQADHYLITMAGGKTMTRVAYSDWYDKMLSNICNDKGIDHKFKSQIILKNKHVNAK